MRPLYARSLITITAALLLGLASSAQAQSLGIGTAAPDPKAALDIQATDKGLLIPRMDSATRAQITAPPDGLMVFQTNGRKGFWYAVGGLWVFIPDKTRSGDNLGSHTASQDINLQNNGLQGTGSTIGTTIGIGVRADGGMNIGQNTIGNNIYVGYQAGQATTTGSRNLFVGYGSGEQNTAGGDNQFLGYLSGYNNTTGDNNLFIGGFSGRDNATGSNNLFVGQQAGLLHTSGFYNSFLGHYSGYNTATGANNTFVGYGSGSVNTTGGRHVGIGRDAGPTSGNLTNTAAIGAGAKVSRSNSLVLGDTVAAGAMNVGIGTAAPQAKLHVVGNARITSLGNGTTSQLVQAAANGTLTTGAIPSASLTPRSGPAGPLATVVTDFDPYSVAISGNKAYVVTHNNTLQIFDITNPATPALLGSASTSTAPNGIVVRGTYAYVISSNNQNSKLQTYDVSNPTNPILVNTSTHTFGFFSITLSGNTLCVVNFEGNYLRLFDISNPASPVITGTTVTEARPYSVTASGNYAYVVNFLFNSKLEVFDISGPTPVSLSKTDVGGASSDVAVNGTTAFVVNVSNNRLQTYDVSNPTTPALLGSAATNSNVFSLAVRGATAFVASTSANALQSYDVGDPTNPVLLGTVSTGSLPVDIAAAGQFVYVACRGIERLQVFEQPQPVGLVTQNPDGSLVSLNPTSLNQTLRLTGSTLTLSNNGGTVTLPDASATNELQTISKTGTTVTLSNGGGSFTDTDAQQLSFSGSTISLTNGGSVTIPSSADNLGNHTATQPLDLGANQLVGNGGTNGLSISNTGNVGIGVTGATEKLHLSGADNNGTTATLRVQSGAQTLLLDGNEIDANEALYLQHNSGNPVVLVDGGGMVGVGTATPTARLTISGAETSTHGNNVALMLQNTSATTPNTWTLRAGGAGTNTPNGGFSIGDNTAYRLSITSSGNVGIGTNSPAQTLDVNGNMRIAGLNGTGERLLVADAQGDVQVARHYSAGGSGLTAGQTQVHTYTHNLGYQPVWMLSIESSETTPSLTITYENTSTTQTTFRVYNAGVGAKSYTLHAMPVR